MNRENFFFFFFFFFCFWRILIIAWKLNDKYSFDNVTEFFFFFTLPCWGEIYMGWNVRTRTNEIYSRLYLDEYKNINWRWKKNDLMLRAKIPHHPITLPAKTDKEYIICWLFFLGSDGITSCVRLQMRCVSRWCSSLVVMRCECAIVLLSLLSLYCRRWWCCCCCCSSSRGRPGWWNIVDPFDNTFHGLPLERNFVYDLHQWEFVKHVPGGKQFVASRAVIVPCNFCPFNNSDSIRLHNSSQDAVEMDGCGEWWYRSRANAAAHLRFRPP